MKAQALEAELAALLQHRAALLAMSRELQPRIEEIRRELHHIELIASGKTTPAHKKSVAAARRAEIAAVLESGVSAAEVAMQMGISTGRVYQMRDRHKRDMWKSGSRLKPV